jgi:glycosyltransferase involved in cell wall biosynthesis
MSLPSLILFGCTAALFVTMTVAALINLRYVRRLPTLSALPANRRAAESTSRSVRCSVVVAARDEAARVEETVRRILAQQGVSIEAIVVDDRSADETEKILQRLASADSRVRTVRVEALPEGWLGKCHACHVGASVATGEWILFTDADCWLKPDVLARALCVAGSEGVDHVTLTPGVAAQTCGARAWHLALLTRLAGRIAGVNRDHSGAHLGLGAFNLVRAAAYADCGGYEALRLTVLDDVMLGLLLHLICT